MENILESGVEGFDMDMESWSGMMDASMKGIGSLADLMDMEPLSTRMEMGTKETGKSTMCSVSRFLKLGNLSSIRIVCKMDFVRDR